MVLVDLKRFGIPAEPFFLALHDNYVALRAHKFNIFWHKTLNISCKSIDQMFHNLSKAMSISTKAGMVISLFIGLTFSNLQLSAQTIDDLSLPADSTGIFETTVNNFLFSGSLNQGLPEGNWVQYFPGGMVKTICYYQDGKKAGTSLEIDKNGYLLKQEHFRNDRLDGESVTWRPGARMTLLENYREGKLHGVRKVFYESGSIQEEANYMDGLREGKSSWFDENGKLIATYNYKEGLFEGVQQTYFPEGQLKSKRNYVANKLEGAAVDYYANGQVKEEGVYQDGKKADGWKKYTEDGILKK